MKKIVSKIKFFITSNYWYKYMYVKYHKRIVEKNPKIEMNRVYYSVFHRNPDLEHPVDLIEKIYWMQLHADTSLWTRCADKFAMRGYVKECGYDKYLPQNLGKWDNSDDIDFNSLPNEFVLKTNNSCGTVMLIKDKSQVNYKKIRRKLKQWLKIPYGWGGAQLHYTRIRPCIIAEELLHQDEKTKAISPNSLVDYKIWCINGKPESICVAYNRHDIKYINIAMYDTQWNPIPENLHSIETDKYNPDIAIPKPNSLEKMLRIAEDLSKPFPEVRVDFYEIDGKPIIGEMTFTSGFGFFTEDYYKYLGSKMDISNVRK